MNHQLNSLIITSTLILFALTGCKKEDSNPTPDPCAGITCLNGGKCVNGDCDCPTGYTGPDCGSQKTPSNIRVTNIRVTKFPPTDENGGGWDLTDGADIYVTMSYNSNIIYNHPNFYEDASPQYYYDFKPTVNLNLTYPTNRYVITLWDYDDFSNDDFMGGIEFTPYIDGNKFPKTLKLDAGGGVAFELSLEYTFN